MKSEGVSCMGVRGCGEVQHTDIHTPGRILGTA